MMILDDPGQLVRPVHQIRAKAVILLHPPRKVAGIYKVRLARSLFVHLHFVLSDEAVFA